MPHHHIFIHCDPATPGVKSWLDHFPVTHSRVHKQDARLESRVDKIKETLALLKCKIDIRRQLVGLAKTDGVYCVTCSRRLVGTNCGPTCPLLRPGGGSTIYKRGKDWVYFAEQDCQDFDKLDNDVNAYGAEANKQMVHEWEATAAHLLERTDDSPNRYRTLRMKTILGFDQDWSFEGHWGKGSGVEDDVAPDETLECGKDETRVEE